MSHERELEPRLPASADVLVATVSEAREPYATETLWLYRSLRAFGGTLAEADGVAYFVEHAPVQIAEALGRIGVHVRIVDRVFASYPHANKIRMFLDGTEDHPWLVALDNDVVIAGDFVEHLRGDALIAKPVDNDLLDEEKWRRLFDAFGVAIPPARHLTSFRASETIAYFNSGVLFVPRRWVAPLGRAWLEINTHLLDLHDRHPNHRRQFADQQALSIALAKLGVPSRAGPLEINFPTHRPIHPYFRPGSVSPLLLHHHHRRNERGTIASCGYPGADARISAVNAVLEVEPEVTRAPAEAQSFDNREFWERRYVEDPGRGSGLGSRGIIAEHKRTLVQRAIDASPPAMILDVGCGDLGCVGSLEHGAEYTGIDLSTTVIERNRTLRPDWCFVAGDFLSLSVQRPLRAELVLCFDVLIHLHEYARYRAFVAALVAASTGVALVSGYVCPPRPRYRSAITCFHEPLGETLRACGVEKMRIVASYRDTVVIELAAPREARARA